MQESMSLKYKFMGFEEGLRGDPCLGPYGGPKGVAISYERGTPVWHLLMNDVPLYGKFWGFEAPGGAGAPPPPGPSASQPVTTQGPSSLIS